VAHATVQPLLVALAAAVLEQMEVLEAARVQPILVAVAVLKMVAVLLAVLE
jgi:hypothetical protein